MHIRRARPQDLEPIVAMKVQLWPDGTAAEHREETQAILAGRPPSTLPLALLVADVGDAVAGFVEVGLRSHADGCDPVRPCGFIEGWFVAPMHRGSGLGRALLGEAEAWARDHGCTELASDTWLDNEASQRAHESLGFEIVDRCVNYRKRIAEAPGVHAERAAHYGPELARIHHAHFGMVARGAAQELLSRLARAGIGTGTVVDLAAGTGILSRAAAEAGFSVQAIDISDDMLAIARREAGTAGTAFTQGSLWDVSLPPCVAVAAVGEAFSYAVDPSAGLAALARRLAAIHLALVPGGLLLFDVASPGRAGPDGVRRSFWSAEDVHLGLVEEEDGAGLARREITLFVPMGELHRRRQETHLLRLYPPQAIEELLTRAGFSFERLSAYGDFSFKPGWHGWAATKSAG
jgi:aminoglycoside 6'-N-acetyltransferase I